MKAFRRTIMINKKLSCLFARVQFKMNTNESGTHKQHPVPEWFKELVTDACEREEFMNALFKYYQTSANNPSELGTILFALRVKKHLFEGFQKNK